MFCPVSDTTILYYVNIYHSKNGLVVLTNPWSFLVHIRSNNILRINKNNTVLITNIITLPIDITRSKQ